MKRYINKCKSLVLVATAAVAFASCGDFLKIEPKTRISEDNFWNEKADIDQMVAGVYVKMQASGFIERCIMWGETRSDNIAAGTGTAGKAAERVLKEDLLSTNPYTTWIDFYKVISQCNIIIKRADEVSEKDPTYTASDVLATKAEMTCIRDLCYFYLIRAFKDVPYTTKAIQSDGELIDFPAVNGDSIVRLMIPELEACVGNALKAYPKDNDSRFNSNCNRVTQNVIYALLADLCLWDNQYQKCVDYCQKIIDSKYNQYQEDYSMAVNMSSGSVALFKHSNDTYTKGYPLHPCMNGQTYGSAYNTIFGGNQNSFESIFELAFTNGGSDPSYESNTVVAEFYGHNANKPDGGKNYKGLLNASESTLADLVNESYKVYRNKYDCRFYTDIKAGDGEEYTKGTIGKYVGTSATISLASGSVTLPFKATIQGTSLAHNRNWIFYRLTDIMLMQAEALIELGGDNLYNEETDDEGNTIKVADPNLERAFYLIWTVNRRSIMIQGYTNTTQSKSYELNIDQYNFKALLRELCLEERRRELMFEGKRWFDLLRRCHREGSPKYMQSKVTAKGSSGTSSTLFVNYESLYWPYNKNEVRNNPALDQKPYYGNDGTESNNKLTN